MNITQYKTHTSPVSLNGFDSFIQAVLVSFTTELNNITGSFYDYDKSSDGVKGYDNVFKVIERTWVGIFQSALVKTNPNITCLQEFNVIDGDGVFGRCDLLFEWNNGIRNQIITEAKCYEFLDNWNRSLNQDYFNRLLNQAYGYYNTESAYYKEPWLLALTFEWIRNENKLHSAKIIMDNWPQKVQTPDFITLLQGEKRGVFVYGKVVNARVFNNG